MIYSNKPAFDVILLTETWLCNDIPDSMLDPFCKYSIFRCDRHTTGAESERGGGVCILVAKPIQCVIVDTQLKYPSLELCCVDLIDKTQKYRLFVVYRKPNCGIDSADYMPKLTECFQHYDQVAWPVVITGDFNCPSIDWDNLSVTGDKVQEGFLNYCVSGGFIQLVESPTRNKRILDLILTNEPLCVCVM